MFKEVRLECVPWEKNSNADALAKMGSQQEVLFTVRLEIDLIRELPKARGDVKYAVVAVD